MTATGGAGRQRWLRIAVVVALGAVPLVVRVGCEAAAEMGLADDARAAGDEDEEVLHLGRALRWRLPGASHDERAIERLLAIGEAAHASDPARALVAYREIRSALLGSRALDVPHAEVLRDVDGRIAALMGQGDPAQTAARAAELRVEPERSRTGTVLAAASWLAWVLAAARLLLHGIDARGRLVPGSGTRSALLALGLLVTWLLLWRFA